MNAWPAALVYRATWRLVRLLLRLFVRWEVAGVERIPRAGPLILVANHVHLLDPPVIAAATPRPLRAMAKQELFETPVIGRVVSLYGGFPVRRFAADLGALRTALRYLRRGEVLLMFPEGARAQGAGMRPALPGAAMVALMSRAPVVPVGISGSNLRLRRLFLGWTFGQRPHLRVAFGEPLALGGARADGRAAEEATDLLMRRVAALLPEDERGVYGEHTAGTVVVHREGRTPATGSTPASPERPDCV